MAISGRLSYVYVGGKAVASLKGWSGTLNHSVVDLDPDIGSTWIDTDRGFNSFSGQVEFNFSATDFANVWDAVVAGAAVSVYLYTSSAATSSYLYGSARLSDQGHTNMLGQTVAGTLGVKSTGTWGRAVSA